MDRAGQDRRLRARHRGEAGIDTLPPDECARIREAEERASAAVVGVTSVEFLGHADGVVEYGLPLRRDISAAIRATGPKSSSRSTTTIPGAATR